MALVWGQGEVLMWPTCEENQDKERAVERYEKVLSQHMARAKQHILNHVQKQAGLYKNAYYDANCIFRRYLHLLSEN